ncbi:MAG TPA: FtsW/RodA/SpoVE family cell cycle protein [Gaiellaceae bacterium]|jgi:rod shape determining protein RodA|nr:FtsW/RodA/SpoVE family cell cycle protein [Gaiellaceae bacterium]
MSIEAVDTSSRGLRRRYDSQAAGISLVGRLDWLLTGALAAVALYGLYAIDGITRHDPGGSALTRQALYVGVGGVGFVVMLFIDPARFARLHRQLYLVMLALLALVLAIGAASHGATRWINIGFFQFQPSEFGELLFVLAIAGLLAERGRSVTSARAPLRAIGYGLIAIVLVFVQPDFGTALVYVAALAGALLVSGVRWLHLGLLLTVTVFGALLILWLLPAAGMNVLKPYQTARLTGFTHPSNDPRGATYNLRQSIIAVGAGGVSGRGIIGATQTGLDYLPSHSTDFAFASLAEEHGFFGAAILLLLYLLVVWRALKIVTVSGDLFSAIVAGGIAFMFLFEVFINTAMTMGIAPITGIPLPFVSVGGSAMITDFLALGVLQAIYIRRPVRRRR